MTEVKGYVGDVVEGRVTTLQRPGEGRFVVGLDDGRSVEAHRILVVAAAGLHAGAAINADLVAEDIERG